MKNLNWLLASVIMIILTACGGDTSDNPFNTPAISTTTGQLPVDDGIGPQTTWWCVNISPSGQTIGGYTCSESAYNLNQERNLAIFHNLENPSPESPQNSPDDGLIQFTLNAAYKCWVYSDPDAFWIWNLNTSGALVDAENSNVGVWSNIDGAQYSISPNGQNQTLLTRTQWSLTLSDPAGGQPWGGCWLANNGEVQQVIGS